MRKTFLNLLVSALILTTLSPVLCWAQSEVKPVPSKEVFDHFDKLYKIDSRLVNGDFYQTPKMNESAGHPFFFNPDWKTGSISMEGVVFDKLHLRYDINTGQLILNSSDFTNSYLQVVLKKDRIKYFTLDGSLFKPYPTDNPMTGIQFCQVLEEGQINFLLVKSKNLKVTPGGLSDFVYQNNQSKILQLNDELITYRSRRTLYKQYPELKPLLREYIKKERLAFRSMNLENQTNLITYCNSLVAEKK